MNLEQQDNLFETMMEALISMMGPRFSFSSRRDEIFIVSMVEWF